MRLPQTWKDRSLLEDEPFLTYFSNRAQTRSRRRDDDWNKTTAQKLLKEARDAIQGWLNLAFIWLYDEDPELRNFKVDVEEGAEIFAGVYWLLFQNREHDARVALRHERRKRGFLCDLDSSEKVSVDTDSTKAKRKSRPKSNVYDAEGEDETLIEPPPVVSSSDSEEQKGDIALTLDEYVIPCEEVMHVEPASHQSATVVQPPVHHAGTKRKRGSTTGTKSSSDADDSSSVDIQIVETSARKSPASSNLPSIPPPQDPSDCDDLSSLTSFESDAEAVDLSRSVNLVHEDEVVPLLNARPRRAATNRRAISEWASGDHKYHEMVRSGRESAYDNENSEAADIGHSVDRHLKGDVVAPSKKVRRKTRAATERRVKSEIVSAGHECLPEIQPDNGCKASDTSLSIKMTTESEFVPLAQRRQRRMATNNGAISAMASADHEYHKRVRRGDEPGDDEDTVFASSAVPPKNVKKKKKYTRASEPTKDAATASSAGHPGVSPRSSAKITVIDTTSRRSASRYPLRSADRPTASAPPQNSKSREPPKPSTSHLADPKEKTQEGVEDGPSPRKRLRVRKEKESASAQVMKSTKLSDSRYSVQGQGRPRNHSDADNEVDRCSATVVEKKAPIRGSSLLSKEETLVEGVRFQDLPNTSSHAELSNTAGEKLHFPDGSSRKGKPLKATRSKYDTRSRKNDREKRASSQSQFATANQMIPVAGTPARSATTSTKDQEVIYNDAATLAGSTRPTTLGKRKAPILVKEQDRVVTSGPSTSGTSRLQNNPSASAKRMKSDVVKNGQSSRLNDLVAPPFSELNCVKFDAAVPLEGNEFTTRKRELSLSVQTRSSEALFIRIPPSLTVTVDRRPVLQRAPPVWARSRQEVCETVEWFRSYQGGVYFNNKKALGYLLSGFPSVRDVFHHQGKLIISHGGGKAEALSCKKGRAAPYSAEDQEAEDHSVSSLLKSYKENSPIVLLVDDKYSLFPYNLASSGYTYVALGYYVITRVWAERSPARIPGSYVVRYKFVFQWFQSQGEPWWIDPDLVLPSCSVEDITKGISDVHIDAEKPLLRMKPVKRDDPKIDYDLSDATARVCDGCQKKSPHIYQEGWMCGRPNCLAFWIFKDGSTPPLSLKYREEFLALLPTPCGQLKDIRPPRLAIDVRDQITTTREFTRGFHCKKCGRLSCRFKWEHWECSNCGEVYKVIGRVRTHKELWCEIPVAFTDNSCSKASGITKETLVQYRQGGLYGSRQTFVLPNGHGRIHHIKAHTMANEEANRIFQEYQEQAADGRISFRRWPIRMHKCRGDLLASYFSHNAGAPYHYVGGTNDTVSFDEAPTAVLNARALIQERAKAALGKDYEFNEILSAAYMEKQKMAFHGDDEKGLGPVVASLSLGSPALMHFRVKKGDNKKILTIILRHGDVLVMEGAEVQKCYEHSVIPEDFRIAATARWIEPT